MDTTSAADGVFDSIFVELSVLRESIGSLSVGTSGATSCNFIVGSTATVDGCGVCGGKNRDRDCNGDCFGSASVDDCNECTGGGTGRMRSSISL